MKRKIGVVDALPSKRIYHSIIADYNLERSICELIDNALDTWINRGAEGSLNIFLDLDSRQQVIQITDNAGGIEESKMSVIVAPGASENDPDEEVIGYFGVGTKRAVVDLAQDIKITTRHNGDRTLRVEFDDDWLAEEGWEMDLYEVDAIPENTTIIDLHRLRTRIGAENISNLVSHLESTYAYFISNPLVNIELNGEALGQYFFDNWAYPPDFEPRQYEDTLEMYDDSKVRVKVIAGLASESSPTGGDYGFFSIVITVWWHVGCEVMRLDLLKVRLVSRILK